MSIHRSASTGHCETLHPRDARALRACDSCRYRKIKCIRKDLYSCEKCIDSRLLCTFRLPVMKKGPKKGRYRREESPRFIPEALYAPVALPPEEINPSPPIQHRRPAFFTTDLITRCINLFFTRIEPHMPIISREEASYMVDRVDESVEASCVVYALCAYTLFVSSEIDVSITDTVSAGPAAMILRDVAIATRKTWDYAESAPTSAIVSAIFLFCLHERTGEDHTAWFYIREATTLAHIACLHFEAHYDTLPFKQASRDRCVYWFLFVNERSHALRTYRPVTLHATIEGPTGDNVDLGEGQLRGFMQLTELYRLVDQDFIATWNGQTSKMASEWLESTQESLRSALTTPWTATFTQQIDLICSQAWLSMSLWQLALHGGMLHGESSVTGNQATATRSAIDMLKSVIRVADVFGAGSFRIHGHVLAEKIFHTACIFIDTGSNTLLQTETRDTESDFVINSLLLIISKLPDAQHGFVASLLEKIRNSRSSEPHDTLAVESPPLSSAVSAPTPHKAMSVASFASEDSLTRVSSYSASSLPDAWYYTSTPSPADMGFMASNQSMDADDLSLEYWHTADEMLNLGSPNSWATATEDGFLDRTVTSWAEGCSDEIL